MTDITPADAMNRRCPVCNNPISPETKFCESCGAKIEQQRFCRKCNAPLVAGIKFCESCGTAVAESVPEENITPVKSSPEPVVREETVPARPETAAAPEKPRTAPAPDLRQPPAAPKAPASKNMMIIGALAAVIIIAAAAIFIILPMMSGPVSTGSGTTQTPLSPFPGATVAPAATAAASSTGSSLVPGPVETLPENLNLAFSVDKDAVSGAITVAVTGPARNVVKVIDVRVTHPDGTVSTGQIQPSQKVDEVTVTGSKQTDRVEVTVTFYSGKQYKVIDQLAEYKKRM